MRSTSFVAITLCALSATVFSAPTPQLSNIIGSVDSVTQSGAGNLKERSAEAGLLDPLTDITNTIGSVTEPTVGSGNSFPGNGNGNGSGNGNGNTAGVSDT
jgi:hypothetical protein